MQWFNRRIRGVSLVALCVAVTIFYMGCTKQKDDSEQRPNIVIFLVDDMGFSDLGAYGSEISTPNLDTLAAEGIRFSNYHTAATCSPTAISKR